MLADLIKPKIVELGKIKIGKKAELVRRAQSGREWRAPEKLDHFVITTLARNAKGDLTSDTKLMDSLIAECGDDDGQLRTIPIALLSNDPDEIMQASFVRYSGRRVEARSDGKTLWVMRDKETGRRLEVPKELEWTQEMADMKDAKGNDIFKLHSTFNCVIAAKEARWGGVYKFRTTSKITAAQLYGSLLHIKELTGGVLRGLPMRMVVRPLEVSPGERTTTVYVVHVELAGSDLQQIRSNAMDAMRFELQHSQNMQSMRSQYQLLLTAPGTESEQDQEDIADEFHPDNLKGELGDPPAVKDPLLSQVQDPEPQAELPNSEPVDTPDRAAVRPAPIDKLRKPTAAQIAGLFKALKKSGNTTGQFRNWLLSQYGYEKTSEITMENYPAIMSYCADEPPVEAV